ncbi:MAG: zinc finger domain-containing protein [Candidatus Kariarchaeaceae archaeon]
MKEILSENVASSKIEMDYCYSCNRALSPDTVGSTRFPCPNCGGLIIRCSDCRRLSNGYVCPGCEFQGP